MKSTLSAGPGETAVGEIVGVRSWRAISCSCCLRVERDAQSREDGPEGYLNCVLATIAMQLGRARGGPVIPVTVC